MLPLDKLNRVLVVRTDHVGDLVVSTPFLRSLRTALPRARITAMVAPAAREVLVGNDSVDEILSLDDPMPGDLDLAVTLAPRTAAYKLVHKSRARYRVGYVYPERTLTRWMLRLWLTHWLSIEVRSLLERGKKVPHEVEQLGLLARYLGLPYEDPRPELPVSAADEEAGRELAGHAVVVHLSTGWLTWGWSLQDFVELCSAITGPVVVSYGPAEAELAANLASVAPELKLVGGLTLKRWAGLLGACRCVLSTDTGAVHVAAARGTPVVVAYQPQHFELCSQQWYPWGVPSRGFPKGAPLVWRSKVVQAVEELLKGPRKGSD